MLDGIYNDTRDHMQRCVDSLLKQLSAIRTGKATPALLEGIMVEAYGAKMPLNQVATLAAPEARLLTLSPFDATQIANIEKAIQASNLGITPTNDGSIIRLPIPPLTEERRKDFVKMAKEKGEEAKVAVRGARREANDKLKKAQSGSDITEDEHHRGQTEVQKMTDTAISEIDKVLEEKEKQIMEV
ncbi:ribosome recycling factor [bacterium]|nr:MAG: ribosome recycling factor [bacterium]